jgi:peptidoglycan/xylan/chitin deacetylase (PgdA/CDA1 family)
LKRIVNLLGSILVRAADGVRDLLRRVAGKPPRRTCMVLAYHSVTERHRALFASQMDVLLRHARPVAAGIQALPEEAGRYAAVTFDDGLANLLQNALPELSERSIPSTLFIVTEALDGYPSWEYFGGDDPSEQKTMSEQQLQGLPSAFVTIGSHSMNHPVLPHVDAETLRRELVGSREKLEKILHQEVKLFSFPYGAFSQDVIDACREARYERVFTALPVFAISQPGEFVTGRVGVNPTDWPIEFRLKLSGSYRWLPHAFALKRRLVSIVRGGGNKQLGLTSEEKRVV